MAGRLGLDTVTWISATNNYEGVCGMNYGIVSQEQLEQIDKICATHKGKHTLRMELIDFQNKEKLPFIAQARKVTVGNAFLSALELLGVECGVN